MKRRAAVVGLGLMGGSLGMALRKTGRWRVVGVGRNAARLAKARRLGAADETTTSLAEGVRDADVVVLAAPVDEIIRLAKAARPHLKPGALVTDVGSVKGAITAALEAEFSRGKNRASFVGAHPMCGSEKSGVENARADLYRGAPCALTPTKMTPAAALRDAAAFWTGVGARVLRLSPEDHDRRVAVVSHLPHLIADALVLTAARQGRGGTPAGVLAAGSFRDATRVAGADPALWAQIFSMNRPALLRAAAAFQKELRALLGAPTAARLSRVKDRHRVLLGASL